MEIQAFGPKNLIGRGLVQGLNFAGWPANDRLFDVGIPAQAEMQGPLIFGAKAAAAGDFLHLLPSVPKQPYLRADGAAITGGPFEFKFDPPIFRRHLVLIDEQRAFLIGDHQV